MLFSNNNLQTNIDLKIGEKYVDKIGQNWEDKYFRFFGHVIDDTLSWEGHVEYFLPLRIRLSIY